MFELFEIQKKKDSATRKKRRNAEKSAVYPKYIYAQEMRTREHNLNGHKKLTEKDKVRSITAESHLVKKIITFDVTQHMFYCFKDFNVLPHGSADKARKEKDMEIIQGKNRKLGQTL